MYRKAVALDSNFASAHALLAALYNRYNDVPRATYHFERALAQVDRLPVGEALRIRVADSFARGDLDDAVRYSEQLVGLRPRDFAAWSRLGFYLFQAGRAKEAREAYAVADSLGPLSATGIMNFGSAWASEARSTTDAALYDSARVRFARAIAMQPSTEFSPYYNQTYGTILLGAGFPDSARATFVRLAARSPIDRLRALRSLAFLESMEGHWEAAIEDLTEAAELSIASQQWTSALRNYALVADLLLTLGDRRAAAAPLRDATGIALNRPIEARAVAFVALAQVKAGNAAAAARLLDRMRTISRAEHVGEQVAILTVEGAAHLAAGRAAEARTTLETAFKRDPTSNQLPMLLARARAATGADSAAADLWARAAREFVFGFEGQFDWQFAWYELGLVQERMGRREEALASYRRAVAPYAGIATGGGRVPPALTAARERIVVLEGQGR